jgi:hypothetical protein
LRIANDNGKLGGIVRRGLKVEFRLPRGVGSVTVELFANGEKGRKIRWIGEMGGQYGLIANWRGRGKRLGLGSLVISYRLARSSPRWRAVGVCRGCPRILRARELVNYRTEPSGSIALLLDHSI